MPYPQRRWWTAPEFAQRASSPDSTARRWIQLYGLGRKVGGRWRVDPAAAARFIGTDEMARLNPDADPRPEREARDIVEAHHG